MNIYQLSENTYLYSNSIEISTYLKKQLVWLPAYQFVPHAYLQIDALHISLNNHILTYRLPFLEFSTILRTLSFSFQPIQNLVELQ